MEGQANYLAEWEAAGDWRLGERYLERLLSATGEQVHEAARRYLVPERAGLVVYRPESAPVFAADGGAYDGPKRSGLWNKRFGSSPETSC